MNVFEAVVNRRSIRNFDNREVSKLDINKLIEAAHWAPSGKNYQPWKFAIVQDRVLVNDISTLSAYKKWMRESSCLIIVYLDKQQSYDYKKDLLAIGAAIQNILLVAHDNGIGCCWVGEIIKNEQAVNEILGITSMLELIAVIAVGYPDKNRIITAKRKSVDECILKWL